MSLDDHAMSSAIATLYDCVPDPARWPGALAQLCGMADGIAATLAVLDTSNRSARFASVSGDPAITGPLVSTYAAEMPFYDVLDNLDVDVPIALSDVLNTRYGRDGRRTWLESRLYREWAEPNGIASSINIAVLKQPGRLGALNIVTHLSRRNINVDDLAMMSVIAPHIRRAVTVSDLFGVADRRADMFEDLLDALTHAVVVVSAGMHVLYANPAARTLLDDQSTMRLVGGGLALTYPEAAASVAAAVAAGHREEFLLGPAGIAVPLSRADRPAVAHVLPLTRRPQGFSTAPEAAAAIFIAAAGDTLVPAIDAIAALFSLTAAEKRVAGLVAEGRTRAEIAAAHGVSDGTVESQLSIIFDKTSTADQRELQLLLRELTPPVRVS